MEAPPTTFNPGEQLNFAQGRVVNIGISWMNTQTILKRNRRWEKVLVNYSVTNALPRVNLESSNYVLHLAEQRAA